MRILTFILLLSSVFANAADPGSSTTVTNELVVSTELIHRLAREARTNNPSLRAANARLKAAELNAGAVRTWDDPLGTLGGEVFSSRGMDPAQTGDLIYGVQEKLPLWGKPAAARSVAEKEISTRRAEADLRFQELVRDLTQGLLRAALAERVVDIDEQDLTWLEMTAKTAESRYRAGQAVLADVLQIQNEVAKRREAVRTDHHRLEHEHLSLNDLLNRPVITRWPPLRLPEAAPAVPFSEKLVSLGLVSQPRLKRLAAQIEAAEASAELTRKMRLPDISLGVEGRQYSGDAGLRSGMFTLSFPLPWGNNDKYRKEYLRDKERQKAAEEELRDQVLMVREHLHHFTVDIEAARREALLYRDEILGRAEQALSDRLIDWQSGHGTFRDVLDARRMLIESQLMAARSLAEQHEAIAELLLWTGLNSAEALLPLSTEPSITAAHEP